MARVKVWNDNIYPHTETFKGEKINIPAGSYVEMDWEEAIEFKGQFTGIAPLGPDGKPDARYFKKIRLDAPSEPIFKDEKLINHADGKKYDTRDELLAALAEFADRRVSDPDLDKELSKNSKNMQSQIDALTEQVAQLTAALQGKKKPGRPALKKEA